MAKINLDIQELKNQAMQMTSLGAEYETLFSGVNSILVNVNHNWSQNLSNNFSRKISAAQRSFSQVTEMLKFGADAANSSAESFESIDVGISKVMNRNAHSGNSGTVHGGGGASISASGKVYRGTSGIVHGGGGAEILSSGKVHSSSSDTEHGGGSATMQRSSKNAAKYMSMSSKNIFPETIRGGYGDDWKDIAEDNYHHFVDGDSADEGGYTRTTYGTTTGRKTIIDNLYYEKKRDVEEYYANYQKGNNYENASGKISKTGEEIVIGQHGCAEKVNIKINHVDYHGDAKFDPKKGSAYVSAGVEYDVASVGFELGDSINGLGAAEANVKIGLGAGVKAGVHNGIIKVDASLAVGLGVDVSFEINYKNWKDAFVDAFTFNKD